MLWATAPPPQGEGRSGPTPLPPNSKTKGFLAQLRRGGPNPTSADPGGSGEARPKVAGWKKCQQETPWIPVWRANPNVEGQDGGHRHSFQHRDRRTEALHSQRAVTALGQ